MSTTGNDAARVYHDAIQAQQGERITNLNRRQTDFEAEVRSGFKQMEAGLTTLGNEMRAAVAGLSANIADRSRVQWPAIGVAITFCTVLAAGFAYPINGSITRLDDTLTTIADKMVTRQEIDWRTARAAEDRLRLESRLSDITGDIIPKDELNHRFADQQRQIDLLREEGKVH